MKLSFFGGVICLLLLSGSASSQAQERLVTPASDGIIYSPSRMFSINYLPERIEGFQVELWYAVGDETQWLYYGADDDGEAPISFAAERDALYLFCIRAATDSATAGQPAPLAPQMRVAVDTQRPVVTILSPSEGERFRRGEMMSLVWQATDENLADSSVEIGYKMPGAEDWVLAATGFKSEGRFSWQPPATAVGDVGIRIRAMDKATNWGEDSLGVFVGRLPIEVPWLITGPVVSKSREIRLSISPPDEISEGASSAELWVTEDGGESWRKHGEIVAGEENVEFPAPNDGAYGFRLVEKGGNGEREVGPSPGVAPQWECLVDTEAPEVSLVSPIGGELWSGREAKEVVWRASDENLPPRPVSLFYSTDGGESWRPIASGLENTGDYLWEAPWIAGAQFRVKVTVTDLAGNASEAASGEVFAAETSLVAPKATEVGILPEPEARVDDATRPGTDSVVPTPAKQAAPEMEKPDKSAREMEREGASLRAKGHLGEAERLLREAHEEYPEDARVTNDLGATLVALQKYEEAVQVLSAIEGSSDAEHQYNLGTAYQRLGELDSALAAFQVALELDPGFAEAKWALAATMMRLGLAGDARRIWRELADEEALPEAWRRRASELGE